MSEKKQATSQLLPPLLLLGAVQHLFDFVDSLDQTTFLRYTLASNFLLAADDF